MTGTIRSQVTLALLFSLAGAVSFAQSSGETIYKSKCQMCHGAAGAADTPTAKMLKVKPVSDPDIKKLTADQMFDSVKNGKGKMQPFKDKLTDDQIKDSVTYYRGLK
ncbi:MAG TPA: cytochrome c [Terracidiphilus sp.]|nr:cytochrome c [Terracidiphilus sp.]